jgi:hypothetical protein
MEISNCRVLSRISNLHHRLPSSIAHNFTGRSRIVDIGDKAGTPSARIALSFATISVSGALWETASCLPLGTRIHDYPNVGALNCKGNTGGAPHCARAACNISIGVHSEFQETCRVSSSSNHCMISRGETYGSMKICVALMRLFGGTARKSADCS